MAGSRRGSAQSSAPWAPQITPKQQLSKYSAHPSKGWNTPPIFQSNASPTVQDFSIWKEAAKYLSKNRQKIVCRQEWDNELNWMTRGPYKFLFLEWQQYFFKILIHPSEASRSREHTAGAPERKLKLGLRKQKRMVCYTWDYFSPGH